MPLTKGTLTLPANTAGKTVGELMRSPTSMDLAPPERFSELWGILFPRNAAGLVGVQIRNRETLIVPSVGSVDEWVHDDGNLVEWNDEIDLGAPPRVLRVYAYNADTKWPRTIEVRVVSQEVTMRQLLARLAQVH